MSKQALPSTLSPRGLNIRQASAYWGVSAGTFRKLVRLGLAPAPLKLPGALPDKWLKREDGVRYVTAAS